MSNIREDKGYTYGIYSGMTHLDEASYFYISSEVGSHVCQAAIGEVYLEMRRLRDEPVGEEELDLSSLEDTPEDTGEEEIELDVTELVQSSEEAKRSSDEVNQKMSRLMGMVDKLESDLESMRAISAKIDSLENELEKRAPTPTEKIEMRSLNSYPYNIKLSDYWKDHEDKYVDLNAGNTTKPDEQYELTRDDVNYGYSESNIRNSFDEEEVDDEDIFKFTT